MVLRSLICTSLLTSLLAACGGAKFSGTAPSTAQAEPTPKADDKTPADAAAPSNKDATGSSPEAQSPAGSTPNGNAPGGNTAATDPAGNPGATPPAASASPDTPAPGTANPGSTPTPGNPGTPVVTNPSTPSPSTPVVTPPVCTAGEKITGARLAFIIDNSGSNSNTDCPAAVKAGTSNGTDSLYTCGAQTNREKAVLAAYDVLAQVGAKNASSALAQSQLAIASFPTVADAFGYDYAKSWTNQTAGWLAVSSSNRNVVANTMTFARAPAGQTPYGAAMNAAATLFNGTPKDGRLNVAILVTDGEPTDRNPAAVLAQANALKAAGIRVIVLDYNGSPAASTAANTKLMTAIEDATVKNGQGHWYTPNYANFSTYLQDLLGTNGQGGLSSKVATSGSVISVQNSAALSAAISSLVSSEAVACQ